MIHTRIGCIDGVSIEIDKWANVYRSLGHKVFFIAGKICEKPNYDFLEITTADHLNSEVLALHQKLFYEKLSKNEILKIKKRIYSFVGTIKPKIKKYLLENRINLLHIENILSSPINLPLSISIKEIIQELKIPSVIRHHDFYWSKSRRYSNFKDILRNTFFPNFKNSINIVINNIAKKDLEKRKGLKSLVIYNKFDVKHIQKPNHYNIDLRRNLGVKQNQILFLQPTRIIGRKKIERSIVLISKFSKKSNKKCVLVITGPYDNNIAYYNKIRTLGKRLKVKIVFASKKIDKIRKKLNNNKIYSIGDIYSMCDVVTFPSDIEGFGNPVIESVIYKKPLFVNNFPVLKEFLKFGFNFVTINGKVTDEAVNKLYKILADEKTKDKILNENIKIANKYFSLMLLKNEIKTMIKKLSENAKI